MYSNIIDSCCDATMGKIVFPDLAGPWQDRKFDWRNFTAAVDFRKKMLDEGCHKICPPHCAWKKLSESTNAHFKRWIKLTSNKGKKENIKLVHEEIKNGETLLESYPFSSVLFTGTLCHSNCLYCFMRYNIRVAKIKKAVNPSVDNYHRIIHLFFNSVGCKLIGGEPLARSPKVLNYLMRTFKKFNCKVELVTNGLYLTTENYKKYCVYGPIDVILISIDSAEPEIYEKTGRGSWKRLKENLFGIINKYPENKIRYINCVVSGLNIYGLDSLIELAGKVKAKLILSPVNGKILIKRAMYELDIFSHQRNREVKTWWDMDLAPRYLKKANECGVKILGMQAISKAFDSNTLCY
jgi:hypothetical protein